MYLKDKTLSMHLFFFKKKLIQKRMSYKPSHPATLAHHITVQVVVIVGGRRGHKFGVWVQGEFEAIRGKLCRDPSSLVLRLWVLGNNGQWVNANEQTPSLFVMLIHPWLLAGESPGESPPPLTSPLTHPNLRVTHRLSLCTTALTPFLI